MPESSACENCGRAPAASEVRIGGLLLCTPCSSAYSDGVRDAVEVFLDTTDVDKLTRLRAMIEVRLRQITPSTNKFAVRSVPSDKRIQTISSIRWHTGLDLNGAYDLIQTCPFEFTAVRGAETCAKEFRDLGCVIEEVR